MDYAIFSRCDDSNRSRPSIPEKSALVKAKHDKLHSEPNKSMPDFNKTPPDQSKFILYFP